MHHRFKSHRKRGKSFDFLLKNWWVGAFIAMAFALYTQSSYQKKQLTSLLERKIALLKAEKKKAIQEKDYLLLRLKSEEDPEWTLLVLKQKLGVVEEGEAKVIFSTRNL